MISAFSSVPPVLQLSVSLPYLQFHLGAMIFDGLQVFDGEPYPPASPYSAQAAAGFTGPDVDHLLADFLELFGEQSLRRSAHSHEDDHRSDSPEDPEHRQARPQLVAPQAVPCLGYRFYQEQSSATSLVSQTFDRVQTRRAICRQDTREQTYDDHGKKSHGQSEH
jgi:hypothetical protein